MLNKFVIKGIAAYMTKKGGKRRGQQQDADDGDDEQQAAAGPKTSIFLTIRGQLQRKGFRCTSDSSLAPALCCCAPTNHHLLVRPQVRPSRPA